MACAFKLTNAIFAAALVAGLALTRPRRGHWAAFALSVGAAFIAGSAPWMWHLTQTYGNPLFPYYNGIFQSPFFALANWRDARWGLRGLGELLQLPWLFVDSTDRVMEARYREPFWFLFFGALAVHLVTRLLGRAAPSYGDEGARPQRDESLLLILVVAGFLLWALLFHYARYLMVLSLVSPIALLAIVRSLAGSDRAACVAMGAAVAVLGCTSSYLPIEWARTAWRQRWYEMGDLGIPDRSVVVLGNGIGFVAPALCSSRVVGLGTNFFFSGLPATGNTPRMLERVHDAMWSNPDQVYHLELLSLPRAYPPDRVYMLLGFRFDKRECHSVESNVGAFRVCRLQPVARGRSPIDLR